MAGEHTPGPWFVAERTPTLIYDDEHQNLALAQAFEFRGDESWPEACTNARLIAAAPDLLAALEAMVLNDTHTYRDCHKAARAAIAKAKAQPPEPTPERGDR